MIKKRNKEIDDTQDIEFPIFDMSFDFTDAPPAIPNTIKDNKVIEMKREIPQRSSIRKVNLPKQVPKQVQKNPDQEKKVKPKASKGMRRVKDNLRIDMVGYDQKPNYSTRSPPNK